MNSRSSPKKILIIKLRKLGDVLLTTPMVRQIRKLYPNAEITYLSEPLGSLVFLNSPNVNRVWQFSRNIPAIEYIHFCYRIHKEKFDMVIDLYGHNKTALITFLSRASIRMGYVKKNRKSLAYNFPCYLPDSVKNTSYNATHGLVMTKQLGTQEDDLSLELRVSKDDYKFAHNFTNSSFKAKTIAFCAHSERKDAQVPIGLLVKIGEYLIEKGYYLYFVYGPGEKELASKVYDKINQPKNCLINYDVPTIPQVKAIFENCFMYIGNDGGNKHLAVAANTPTIGLFYGDTPSAWTPLNKDINRYVQTKNNTEALPEVIKLVQSWSIVDSQFKII